MPIEITNVLRFFLHKIGANFNFSGRIAKLTSLIATPKVHLIIDSKL